MFSRVHDLLRRSRRGVVLNGDDVAEAASEIVNTLYRRQLEASLRAEAEDARDIVIAYLESRTVAPGKHLLSNHAGYTAADAALGRLSRAITVAEARRAA